MKTNYQQLFIQEQSKSNYDFTTENHSEIIANLENSRLKKRLTKAQFSTKAGFEKSTYTKLSNSTMRFGMNSYNRFMALISTPVQKNESELTEQKCIDFLKSTGKYKISKAETITNWIEL